MRPAINFITLVVSDIVRSIDFYTNAFGWMTEGIQVGHEDHCLFDLEGDLVMVLFRQETFYEVTGRKFSKESGGMILSYICSSQDEMLDILSRVYRNGAKPIGETKSYIWGVSSHFEDPDGHIWEIVFFHTNQVDN